MSEGPARLGDQEELAAQVIGQMKASSPEVIRAAHAYSALSGFGHSLRRPVRSAKLFQKSWQTDKIHAFWSHSWQGSKWRKVATLIYLHNSLPAFLVAIVASIVTGLLVATESLPLMINPYLHWWNPRTFYVSIVGFLLFWLTLFLWRPQRCIFLDILCIDQVNPKRKLDGLISIGAILACSESLLVLWDPTYGRRIWCVFELSAFLHSRTSGEQPQLTIRPTLLGPTYLLLSLSISAVMCGFGAVPEKDNDYFYLFQPLIMILVFYPLISTYRKYCCDLESLQRELQEFSLENTTCRCCQVNHVAADGMQMVCDRSILLKCISAWFGSTDKFEQQVRSQVLDHLLQQLSSEIFSYRQCITTMLPISWGFVDTASVAARFGYYDVAVRELLRAIAWWLCIVPSMLLLTLRLSYQLRNVNRCSCLVNLGIVLCILTLWALATFLENWYAQLHVEICGGIEIRSRSSLWLVLTTLPVTVLLFCLIGVHPRWYFRDKESAEPQGHDMGVPSQEPAKESGTTKSVSRVEL